MRRRSRQLRRGAALLVTIAAMLLILTAAATAARVAATCRLGYRMDQAQRLTDDLLVAASEAAIQRWLADESQRIVLPPDVQTPSVEVLHDRLLLDDRTIELHIAAYDQYGMTPIQAARSGSPLRLALPHAIVESLDEIDLSPTETPGLDLFPAAKNKEGPRIFPAERQTVPIEYRVVIDSSEQPQAESAENVSEEESLGGLVATHNSANRPAININTAPQALLEAAFRAAGRGGWEQVIASRREGKPSSIGSLPAAEPSGSDGSSQPRLVGSSDTWAFRIDLRVNRVHRSWWAVYRPSSPTWTSVQRLAIDE